MAAGDPTPIDLGGRPVDRDKLRSLGVQATDRTNETRTTVHELGHEITHYWSDDSRQDVTIKAKPIQVGVKTGLHD